MRKILVIGSINFDLMSGVHRFPEQGETVVCENFSLSCGGKGANQAIAAARLGAQVSLIGAIGDDELAVRLLANLEQEKVNTTGIRKIAGVSSGMANIVTCRGENYIIVAEGANKYLTVEDIFENEALFEEADIILSQLEIPLETVEAVAQLAEKYQKPFILNPAPAKRLSQELLDRVTLLTPNEHEFVFSLDLNDSDVFGLLSFVTEKIVLTRGEEGAYFFHPEHDEVQLQPSFQVETVDSTGAGDTFSAAMAVYYHLGIVEAVKRACVAAALSVCEEGAQTGMPTEEMVNQFLQEREAG